MSGNVRPAVGLFGKLPARADFVRAGLPRDFVDQWDAWMSGVMSETRHRSGVTWLPAFLEAPVWRFSLPAGLCGNGAALGVWMPSVDKAGRYFPLTLAAVATVSGFAVDAEAEAWLDRCHQAGLSGLEQDAGPRDIEMMLGTPMLTATSAISPQSEWWTDGAPCVAAGRLKLSDMPSAETYAEMLGLQLG